MVPAQADKAVFVMGPIIAVFAALAMFAVIPSEAPSIYSAGQ